MFDIAFSELLLIGVVALVVIGPERLPKVARTMGHLFGRLQRYVSQVKADVNREIELSELSKVKTEFEGAAREFQHDVESKVREAEQDVREVERDIDRQLRKDEETATSDPGGTGPAAPAKIRGDTCLATARARDRGAGDDEVASGMTDTPQESFLSHLFELRDRLIRSLLALAIVFIPTFFFAPDLYDSAGDADDANAPPGLQDDRHGSDHALLHSDEDRDDGRVPRRAALHPLPGLGLRGAGALRAREEARRAAHRVEHAALLSSAWRFATSSCSRPSSRSSRASRPSRSRWLPTSRPTSTSFSACSLPSA